jgi:hypothetical protein
VRSVTPVRRHHQLRARGAAELAAVGTMPIRTWPARPAPMRPDLALRVFDIEAHALRPLQQHAAGCGQADAAARLLEQRRTAGLLQPPDALVSAGCVRCSRVARGPRCCNSAMVSK